MIKLDGTKAASLSLRVGLAFIFLYAGTSSLMHPLEWVGFLPNYLITFTHLSGMTVIKMLAWYEIVLSLWLLTGLWTVYSALLATITLMGIVVATPDEFITTFRDVGLLCMAIALFFLAANPAEAPKK